MGTPLPLSFGALLKRHRRAAGFTQEQLATHSGYSAAYISALERNVRRPHPEAAQRLAETLGLEARTQAALLAAIPQPPHLRTPSAPVPLRPSAVLGEVTPAMVGRARELSQLGRHLAGEGRPLLLLCGEPGIGKTRLLEEARTLGHAQGWTVIAGGSPAHAGQAPYAPVVEALAHGITTRSRAEQRLALRGCAWLVRLLPELAETGVVPAPTWQLPPEQEYRLLFTAVARFLANIAGPAGTVLILDDLQWADQDTLQLLAFLVRAAAVQTDGDANARPLRIIGAYRDTALPPEHPLALFLADAAHEGYLTRMPLTPLTRDEAEQLLARLLDDPPENDLPENDPPENDPPENDPPGSATAADTPSPDMQAVNDISLRQQVLERADGLPFFLVSFAHGLRAGAGSAIPWSLAASIRQRVALLPAAAREMLGVAAVAGRCAPRAALLHVADALGWERRETLDALDAAHQAALLADADAGQHQFVHDVIREVLEADLSATRRATWHVALAEALEHLPQAARRAADLAWHFAQGDEPVRALPYALQAGDQAAAVCAHTEAEHHYRLAACLAGALGEHVSEAEAWEKLGGVLYTMAHYEEALEVLERAASYFATVADRTAYMRVLARIVWTQSHRGTAGLAADRLAAELDQQTGRPWNQEVVAVADALCFLYFTMGRYTDVLAVAKHATGFSDADNEAAHATSMVMHRASALLALGRLDEGLSVLQQAITLFESNQHVWALVFALAMISYLHEDQGHFALSQDNLEHALALAERLDDPVSIWIVVSRRGLLHYYQGHWEQARTDLERAVALARGSEATWEAAFPFYALGTLDIAEGRRERGRALLDQALTIARHYHNMQAQRLAQMALAEDNLMHNSVCAARACLEPLLDHPGQQEVDVIRLLWLAAWAALEEGEVGQASAWVEACIVRCRHSSVRRILVDALRIQGLAALRAAGWQEAETALEESLALCREMGYPYAEAKALYVSGLLYRARGEIAQARQQFEQALDILAQLGERLYAERIEHELAD